MPDPIFESFQQPVVVSPADPREIRRRGERRRRRTTIATVAGAVLVAVAVVAPVAALTRGDDKTNPPILPSPSPTRTADAAWVHTIPDDFPLGDGIPMPGEASAEMEHGKGVPLQPCRVGQSSRGQSGWADVATATNADVVDPADGTDMRVLALYADAPSARHALDSIAKMYGACPPGQSDAGAEAAEPIGDGNAWVITVVGTDLRFGGIVTVERVGNALLVQQDSLRTDYPGGQDAQLADIRAGQARVVAAMCVFAPDPAGC